MTIKCDFCGGPIPKDGEGYPEICPLCIRKEMLEEAVHKARNELSVIQNNIDTILEQANKDLNFKHSVQSVRVAWKSLPAKEKLKCLQSLIEEWGYYGKFLEGN